MPGWYFPVSVGVSARKQLPLSLEEVNRTQGPGTSPLGAQLGNGGLDLWIWHKASRGKSQPGKDGRSLGWWLAKSLVVAMTSS